MLEKNALPQPLRQPVVLTDQPRSAIGASRFGRSRLAELQRVERKRLDRFGRFGGR